MRLVGLMGQCRERTAPRTWIAAASWTKSTTRGVGTGGRGFFASSRVLGVSDGADSGSDGDRNVGDGVSDERAFDRRHIQPVEGSVDRVRMWLHQVVVTWCASENGLDQVVELVRRLGVVLVRC